MTGNKSAASRRSSTPLLACERDEHVVMFTIFPEIATNSCITILQMKNALSELWKSYPDAVIPRSSFNYATGLSIDRDATEVSAPLTRANIKHMAAPPAHPGCGPDHFFLVTHVVRQPHIERSGMLRQAWCVAIAIRPSRILRVLWFLSNGKNVEIHFRNWTKVADSALKGISGADERQPRELLRVC